MIALQIHHALSSEQHTDAVVVLLSKYFDSEDQNADVLRSIANEAGAARLDVLLMCLQKLHDRESEQQKQLDIFYEMVAAISAVMPASTDTRELRGGPPACSDDDSKKFDSLAKTFGLLSPSVIGAMQDDAKEYFKSTAWNWGIRASQLKLDHKCAQFFLAFVMLCDEDKSLEMIMDQQKLSDVKVAIIVAATAMIDHASTELDSKLITDAAPISEQLNSALGMRHHTPPPLAWLQRIGPQE